MAPAQELESLRDKVGRLKWANDDLRSKLFEANQCTTRLVQAFGFEDVQHAQDAINLCSPDTNIPRLNNRISNLEAELHKLIQISKKVLEIDANMQAKPQKARQASQQPQDRFEARDDNQDTVSASLSRSFGHDASSNNRETLLQAQLANLQARYDHLVETKTKAARRYRQDYRKWKNFKHWLCKSDNSSHVLPLSLKRHGTMHRNYENCRKADLSKQHPEFELHVELDASRRPSKISGDFQHARKVIRSAKLGDGDELEARRPLENYMEFKGHGRYRQSAEVETTSAKSKIDQNQNEGSRFKYDGVERNRDKRKHMHAADCECCRDYYKAIGPLPPRLQPPLWQTPLSPALINDQLRDNSIPALQQQDITDRKKKISRHRQRWDMPATPPQYWNIGFPTTQEVSEINKQAREINDASISNNLDQEKNI